jgi:hypothetical protein
MLAAFGNPRIFKLRKRLATTVDKTGGFAGQEPGRVEIAATRERRARCKDIAGAIEADREDQISLTDGGAYAWCCGLQHTKHKLIVEQQVTNQVANMGLLTQTAEPAQKILGVETITAVADKGHFKIEDIEACEKAGSVPYIPRPQRGPLVKAGLFRQVRRHHIASAFSHGLLDLCTPTSSLPHDGSTHRLHLPSSDQPPP